MYHPWMMYQLLVIVYIQVFFLMVLFVFFFFFLRKSQAEHHIWGHSQTQPLGELERLSQPIHI